MSMDTDSLFPIVGDLNALDLWPTVNLVLPAYLLLVLLPRWKHTATVTLIIPAIHGFIYTLTLVATVTKADPIEGAGFDSLQGVYAIFRDPNSVFAGWIHYCAFDLLVSRGIVLDAVNEKKVSNLFFYIVVVPCLFFTVMAGPIGYIMYLAARTVFLAGTEPSKAGGSASTNGKKEE